MCSRNYINIFFNKSSSKFSLLSRSINLLIGLLLIFPNEGKYMSGKRNENFKKRNNLHITVRQTITEGMYRELMPVSVDVDIICWSTSVIGNSSRKVYSIK